MKILIDYDARNRHKAQLKDLLGVNEVIESENVVFDYYSGKLWNNDFESSQRDGQLPILKETLVDFLMED